MNVSNQFDQANDFLRRACRRGRNLSALDRQKLIKICIAFLGRQLPVEQKKSLLLAFANEYGLSLDKSEPIELASEVDAVAQNAVIIHLLHCYYGDPLPEERDEPALVEQMLEELNQGLRTVCQIRDSDNPSWQLTLKKGALGLKHIETAMQLAAKESFDRLIGALNPAGAKKQLERGKWKITALYKAELYDATSDKYKQLKAYHDKGRLVRDFRSLYKMHHKRSLKKMESS